MECVALNEDERGCIICPTLGKGCYRETIAKYGDKISYARDVSCYENKVVKMFNCHIKIVECPNLCDGQDVRKKGVKLHDVKWKTRCSDFDGHSAGSHLH